MHPNTATLMTHIQPSKPLNPNPLVHPAFNSSTTPPPCQVYASYGPRSNGDLLLAYGMLPGGRNPNDSVEVQLAMSAEEGRGEEKREAMEKCGLKTYPKRR